MSTLSRLAMLVLSLTAWAAFPLESTARQTVDTPERFTALAVNMEGFWLTRTGPVEIVVSHWSSESEQSRLTQILLDKGSDALLDALRDTPRVGYIRTPNSIGYDLHFARALPGEDGGRRVILATDRPITFWEARNQPRSIDYPFTVIELRMDVAGEGEGKLSIAAKITGNKQLNVIELEDYGSQPVRLLGVRSDRRPTS
jgi:hypothetical protein